MPGRTRQFGGNQQGGGQGGNERGERRDRRGGRDGGGRGGAAQEKTPHLERVVAINRVAKVGKGGRRRRRRHGRCRLRQGEGGAGRHREGCRGGEEELLPRASDRRHHSAPHP